MVVGRALYEAVRSRTDAHVASLINHSNHSTFDPHKKQLIDPLTCSRKCNRKALEEIDRSTVKQLHFGGGAHQAAIRGSALGL